MTPRNDAEFFLATAGAGAAFIGLLFVALSLHPERTFRHPAADGVPRQLLTEATLLSLGNGFVLSCVALLSTLDVGWIALGSGCWGVLWAARLAQLLARSHRHARAAWPHRLRVMSLSLVAVVLYASQVGLGLILLRQPASTAAWTGLALIILGVYALGLARAWILLGDPRYGWSGRLNPLADETRLVDVTDRAVADGRPRWSVGGGRSECRRGSALARAGADEQRRGQRHHARPKRAAAPCSLGAESGHQWRAPSANAAGDD